MPSHKKVPAVEKCFAILELMAKTDRSLGISDISRHLSLNKSTVFNMVHTLIDLNVLNADSEGKFEFGPRFYMLGQAAKKRSKLIHVVHPCLERINRETKLSAFLGIRSHLRTVLIDKVDSAYGVKVSSEIGMQMPALAGAAIKAMISLLDKPQADELIDHAQMTRYTPRTIVDKAAYKAEIDKVRREGFAFDEEEYIEGLVAVAAPIHVKVDHMQAAIWAVGLAQQVPPETLHGLGILLKEIAEEIDRQM